MAIPGREPLRQLTEAADFFFNGRGLGHFGTKGFEMEQLGAGALGGFLVVDPSAVPG